MIIVKKIIWLFLVSALSATLLVLGTIAVFQIGLLGDAEALAENNSFRLGYFGGIMWALFAGVLGGVFYFFIENPVKARWFLWAPLYIPLLYMVVAVAYFS